MDYTFTTLNGRIILRVKDIHRPELPTGTLTTVITGSGDMVVRHTFRIVTCIKRSMDAENNHYAWYEVKDYSSAPDYTPGMEQHMAKLAANMDYVCMMADIDLPEVDEDGTQPEV